MLVADSQYSSRRLREKISAHGVEAVIPYPANQRPKEKGLLRVDEYFRTYGPARERKTYQRRASIERMVSRLKEQLGLNRHRVRGLRNMAVHVPLCIIAMLLVALVHAKKQRTKTKKFRH